MDTQKLQRAVDDVLAALGVSQSFLVSGWLSAIIALLALAYFFWRTQDMYYRAKLSKHNYKNRGGNSEE